METPLKWLEDILVALAEALGMQAVTKGIEALSLESIALVLLLAFLVVPISCVYAFMFISGVTEGVFGLRKKHPVTILTCLVAIGAIFYVAGWLVVDEFSY